MSVVGDGLNFLFVHFSCIKFLIEKQEDVSSDEDLIAKTIPEIIVAYNHGSSKKDNTALNLIIRIGEIYQVCNFLLRIVLYTWW